MNLNERHPKLIFFSGLGADERLFAPQQAAFPDLLVPPWIPPRKGEGLADYAVRLAETLPHGEPIVLGGISFGGMIAYEVARHVRPKAVILIASCCTQEGIRRLFRTGGMLWPIVPKQIFRIAQFSVKRALHLFGLVSAKQQKMLVEMFREMDPYFMHWAVSAILHWNPPSLENIPVFHIHGGRDRVIPARRVTPDSLIPHGGHLINLTHAEEVNDFIRAAVRQISANHSLSCEKLP